MTKLKTLKDLQKDCEWKFDTLKALKQEAIKRIRYLEKINKEKSKFARKEFIKGRIHELKDFFNISEEDLK